MNMFKIIIIHINTDETFPTSKIGSIELSESECNKIKLTKGTLSIRTVIGTAGSKDNG